MNIALDTNGCDRHLIKMTINGDDVTIEMLWTKTFPESMLT